MIEFLASEPHFWDHLSPIAAELKERGKEVDIYCMRGLLPPVFDESRVCVVASFGDLRRAQKSGRRTIYLEHGAGQTYSNRHTSYAGGSDRTSVIAFLVPGPHVAEKNVKHYPHIPCYEIGVPKLDKYHKLPWKDIRMKETVCISFHWDCTTVAPEARNAFDHYKYTVPLLADRDEYNLIGHCHPRAQKELKPWFEQNGIPFVERFEDVLNQADLYVCDNSSTIFEFASLKKPVVLLNAPWYRKDVKHGLRFWDYASVGLQVDDPKDLHRTILAALGDDLEQQEKRDRVITQLYSFTDGRCTARAADAIMEAMMSAEKKRERGVLVRALTTASGAYGMVDRGFVVEITDEYFLVSNPDGLSKPVVVNNTGMNPLNYAKRLTSKKPGRKQIFEFVADLREGGEEPMSPGENKMLNKPEPVKQAERPIPERPVEVTVKTEKADPKAEEPESTEEDEELVKAKEEIDQHVEDPLHVLIFRSVLDGKGKQATIEAIGRRKDYTPSEAKEAFNQLVKEKKILVSGPSNRPSYTVADSVTV